jgi:hypothetical protein
MGIRLFRPDRAAWAAKPTEDMTGLSWLRERRDAAFDAIVARF